MTFGRHFIEELFQGQWAVSSRNFCALLKGSPETMPGSWSMCGDIQLQPRESAGLALCAVGELALPVSTTGCQADICVAGHAGRLPTPLSPLRVRPAGIFPVEPECLHFHEVFKAEWKTQQGKWWFDQTYLFNLILLEIKVIFDFLIT